MKIIEYNARNKRDDQKLELEQPQSFLTIHTTAINSFKSPEIQDKMDYLIFDLALRNLDNSTRKAFERKWSSQTMPTFQSLIEFVDEFVRHKNSWLQLKLTHHTSAIVIENGVYCIKSH